MANQTIDQWVRAFEACEAGKPELLQDQIKVGLQRGHFSNKGATPLAIAATRGYAKSIELILPHSNPNSKNPNNGHTALITATVQGHAECVRALIPASQVNAQDQHGNTALIYAARAGHDECVSLLLPVSDLTLTTYTGYTALMMAAERGHSKCIEQLSAGSDMNAQDRSNGWTALMWASRVNRDPAGLNPSGDYVECIKTLMPLSNVNARDDKGWTALMIASNWGNQACVEALISASDATLVDHDGQSALMLAAKNGHTECVEKLLPFSNIHALDSEGCSAFDHASYANHSKVTQILGSRLAELTAQEIEAHMGVTASTSKQDMQATAKAAASQAIRRL